MTFNFNLGNIVGGDAYREIELLNTVSNIMKLGYQQLQC